MINIISVRTLRPRLSKVLENVNKKFDRYIITKRGRPEAVLLSIDEYESLLETMEIQSDPVLMKHLARAEKDMKAGKGITLEEFDKELGIV